MTDNAHDLTPARVLRRYFYLYLIFNLILSLAIVVVFKYDHQNVCKSSLSKIDLFNSIVYFVPSIGSKIVSYESFAEHPVDLCFLKLMYVAIIIASILVTILSVVPLTKAFRTMENDKATHIAIFAFIVLGGMLFGSVNQTRIGLIEIHYGDDGIFIVIEAFYYTLIGGLIADIMCNIILGLEKILNMRR